MTDIFSPLFKYNGCVEGPKKVLFFKFAAFLKKKMLEVDVQEERSGGTVERPFRLL